MKKILRIVFISLLVYLTVALLFLHFFTKKYKVSKLSMNGENFYSLNISAYNGQIKGKGGKYMFYAFTDNMRIHFSNEQYKQNGAGLKLRMKAEKLDSCSSGYSAFGYLYDEDFFANRKLKRVLNKRPQVTCDYKALGFDEVDVSFCLSKNDKTPKGFYVYSECPVVISQTEVCKSEIGWSRKNKVVYEAFGNSGGKVYSDFSSVDFSGTNALYRPADSNLKAYNKIELELQNVNDYGTYKNQLAVKAELCNEKIKIRLNGKNPKYTIQTAAFKNELNTLALTKNEEYVLSAFARNDSYFNLSEAAVYKPLVTDLGLVIYWPKENWRCPLYELFRWENFPEVLFFDFKDYSVQNKFFTRLAYFAEKNGYKGTLVDDEFCETHHGYNAHDYSAETLASFYNKAEAEAFNLNEYELLLKEILLRNKIILERDDGFVEVGEGAIVSFSQESPEYLRYTFLAHECWHGIYFTEEDFRDFVEDLYYKFDAQSMDFLQTFWEKQKTLGYDRSDLYLMKNEFMAYIMQQGVSNTAAYFLEKAGWNSVQRDLKDLAQYVQRTKAIHFQEAAEILNDYAFRNWGLSCGRIYLVSEVSD